MRELNKFNQIVLEKFSSRQAYAQIKGHYIPIIMNNITDESVMDVEKRKYYVQSYEFTMLGFLIDEDEFEVSPAVTRLLQVYEVDTKSFKKGKKNVIEEKPNTMDFLFVIGNDTLSEKFFYNSNIKVGKTSNLDLINGYSVFINNNYYGDNVSEIQINTNDVLKIVINKQDINLDSNIELFIEYI